MFTGVVFLFYKDKVLLSVFESSLDKSAHSDFNMWLVMRKDIWTVTGRSGDRLNISPEGAYCHLTLMNLDIFPFSTGTKHTMGLKLETHTD